MPPWKWVWGFSQEQSYVKCPFINLFLSCTPSRLQKTTITWVYLKTLCIFFYLPACTAGIREFWKMYKIEKQKMHRDFLAKLQDCDGLILPFIYYSASISLLISMSVYCSQTLRWPMLSGYTGKYKYCVLRTEIGHKWLCFVFFKYFLCLLTCVDPQETAMHEWIWCRDKMKNKMIKFRPLSYQQCSSWGK